MGLTMEYQDRARAARAGGCAAGAALRATDASINPATGLSTDYLNHFNEAIMLLDMLRDCPDCREDFLAWRARSYREHFAASHFRGRDLAIAAYDSADARARETLDAVTGIMTAVLEATKAGMSGMPAEAAGTLAASAAASLKPLVLRAGAAINGETGGRKPISQALVDDLFRR
jgi:hypothetical protein